MVKSKNKSEKLVLISFGITLFLLLTLALTYGYFLARVNSNDTSNNWRTVFKSIKLNMSENQSLVASSITPGWTQTKNIMVENTGNQIVSYRLFWENVTNTFVNTNDLVYSIVGTSNGRNIAPSLVSTPFPNAGTNLKINGYDSITINPGETHTYVLTISYINASYNQIMDANKAFSGKISIEEATGEENIIVDSDSNMIPIVYLNNKWVKANAYQIGDVDMDKSITPLDARITLLIFYDASIATNYQYQLADANNDGVVTQEDANLVLSMATGEESLTNRFLRDETTYNYGEKQWANAVTLKTEPDVTTLVDYSGNLENGTINGATYVSDGLSFDGIDDYVLLPQNLGVTFPATYSFKFKTSSTDNQIIFGDYSTRAALGLYQNNNYLIIKAIDSSITFATGGLSLNTFYTIDLVYTDASHINAYLNGVELTTLGLDNYWTWPDQNSYIGKRSIGTYFQGVLEKILVYDDILTETEINHNFNVSSSALNDSGIIQDNLKVYYNFKINPLEFYINSKDGIRIDDSDVMGYWVYIPRYRYKLWNSNTIGNQLANPLAIDIEFENKNITKSTGTQNNEWITHPAFTIGNVELNGIWVSKYEVGYNSAIAGEITAETALNNGVYIKPNMYALTNQNTYQQFLIAMALDGRQYGSSANPDGGVATPTISNHNIGVGYQSKMLTNLEWGAVTYLSHSNYGTCTGGSCTNVKINSNSNKITGCGPISSDNVTSYAGGLTCTYNSQSHSYDTEYGVLASTTQNIYGIYDMNGGINEHVMGIMYTNLNRTALAYGNSTFTSSNLSPSVNTQYANLYTYGDTFIDANAYKRGQLGDATKEVIKSTNGLANDSWYSTSSNFIGLNNSWFARGGNFNDGTNSGIFSFNGSNGASSTTHGMRASIIKSN